MEMRELDAGYASQVDAIDEPTWCRILEQFEDANIFQTWSYGAVRYGHGNFSHLVLKERGGVAAVAQARIVRLSVIGVGIAYVRWGPLWRRRDTAIDVEIFRQTIRALRNEYVGERGLVLRLYPVLFEEDGLRFLPILKEEGFSALDRERRNRTILIDLRRPLEELRRGLRPHWQRHLKAAERNGLVIAEGSEDELLQTFLDIYRETVARKRFVGPDDTDQFSRIQRALPGNLKLRVMLCRAGDTVCAGLVCSAMGTTAIYLLGATGDEGLKTRGSYLLHWKLIEWLKRSGFAAYDLHGIDPAKNPGTYRFKHDLGGDNAREVCFLGRFDSSANVLSASFVACGEALRRTVGMLRNMGGMPLALGPRSRASGRCVADERAAARGHD